MRNKWVSIFWGIILVLVGGFFLAQNFNLIPQFRLPVFTWVFAALSLLFFASYLVSGWQNWGWLFPAFIFAGLAVTMYLADWGVQGSILGAPILAGVALPFLIGFALHPRQNWGLLIPSWVFVVLTLITVLADRINGDEIASMVLFSIALPFLVVYLLNRSNWWALIPGLILAAIGVVVLLSTVLKGGIIAAIVLFGIALPFLLIYLTQRENWWALIPGGILASIALVSLLSAIKGLDLSGGLLNGILFLGFATTFYVLWLLRARHSTGWAVYPALVLAGVGVISLLFSSWITLPLVMAVGGGYLIYYALRAKKAG